MPLQPTVLALTACLALATPASARTLNGFVVESDAVDAREIEAGGPPRDGIAALDAPPHVPVSASPWPDDEVVLGIALGGEARAYPVSILAWHEIVNDELGGVPVLVSYCPLCGTGLVFDRRVDGEARRFGVSGLLYRSDLLMYDRETESLWSQIAARAITGPSEGTRLSVLRAGMHRLADWRKRHPGGTVVSGDTGHSRPYDTAPYAGYATSRELHFRAPRDERYHPKMPTVGMRLPDGPARAFPASEVVAAGGRIEERFAGRTVAVAYDPDDQVFAVEAPGDVEVIEGYWFAWMAFHPESTVFRAQERPGSD